MNNKNYISLFLLIVSSISYAESPPDKVKFEVLGYESCLSTDKLSHVQGQPWQIMEAGSRWEISNDRQRIDSPLTQLPGDAIVERDVILSPPAFLGMTKVICNYQEGTVILTKYYDDIKQSAYPKADFIGADDHINDDAWSNTLFSAKTTCHTNAGSLDTCRWAFVHRVDPEGVLPGLSVYPNTFD